MSEVSLLFSGNATLNVEFFFKSDYFLGTLFQAYLLSLFCLGVFYLLLFCLSCLGLASLQHTFMLNALAILIFLYFIFSRPYQRATICSSSGDFLATCPWYKGSHTC